MNSQKQLRRMVVRVTRSPLNPHRWALDLSCGHEVWVTARTRPTRSTAVCTMTNCGGRYARLDLE